MALKAHTPTTHHRPKEAWGRQSNEGHDFSRAVNGLVPTICKAGKAHFALVVRLDTH